MADIDLIVIIKIIEIIVIAGGALAYLRRVNAEQYGFTDKEEYYTNGSQLIPVFRVKQWLEHKALEQEPCDDWYDIPSDEMTFEQARQAVRDLRKKWAEHLEKEPCGKDINAPATDAISREQLERELHAQMAIDAITKEVALDMLEHLPSVQPKQKIGHWRKMAIAYDVVTGEHKRVPYTAEDEKMGNAPVYNCDCGCKADKPYNYCPNCGAKMEGDK
jgi:hypothetical protein